MNEENGHSLRGDIIVIYRFIIYYLSLFHVHSMQWVEYLLIMTSSALNTAYRSK